MVSIYNHINKDNLRIDLIHKYSFINLRTNQITFDKIANSLLVIL